MFVADLLTALEAAHPADSVRILAHREGSTERVAAIKVEDAMLVTTHPRTVLIKPAVELRERDQDMIASAASRLNEMHVERKRAVAYRMAADQVLRQAYGLLMADRVDEAKQYLHDNLPENRNITRAIAASHASAATVEASKPAPRKTVA